MSLMKVGFLQYAVIQRGRDANLKHIAQKIEGESFDLLVLPELFTSGYAFDDYEAEILTSFAEDLEDSPTIKFLSELAKKSGGCITGTIPERAKNGKMYNTAILVSGEGLKGAQRKIHLPDYESRFFSSGNEISPIKTKNLTIGAMTCFDCWFAPLSSKLRAEGAKILVNSSCFGGAVTPSIIPIRALENQCFVISCNRIGEELFDGEKEAYRGESQIVNPDGKILLRADSGEMLGFVDIDLTEVGKPAFGSLITSDFDKEHKRYEIKIDEYEIEK